MFSRCYGIVTVLFLLAIVSAGCGGSSGPTPTEVLGTRSGYSHASPNFIRDSDSGATGDHAHAVSSRRAQLH